jgi:hypothetical protein
LQGKPLFVWYHLSHFDRPEELVDRYRSALRRHGFEVVVGHFIKNPFDSALAAVADVSYLFEPRLYFGFQRASRGARAKKAFDMVTRLLGERAAQRLLLLVDLFQQKGHVFPAVDYLAYRCAEARQCFVGALPGAVQEVVSPGWNNAPRYEDRFTALESITPEVLAEQLRSANATVSGLPPLINAWNEWSEGAAVEPCAYFGSRYLDALNVVSPSLSIDLALQSA